jgi:hypothetical protein
VKPEDQLPPSAITAWHEEMSTFLKSIDPYKHIVTTSVSHRDVEGMNDLKNIDINQKHIYKNTAGIPETIREYTKKHNKPYIIGESGYEWDWSKNFNDFGDEMDADFKRALWYGLFSPTPVLPMSWWWEFFENRGMMSYFTKVSEINRSMLEAGKGKFESFDVKAVQEGVQAYGVRCGEKNFAYLYNSTTNAESIIFGGKIPSKTAGEMNCFDCETGEYSSVKYSVTPGKSIKIDSFKLQPGSDVILIWD